MDIGIIGTGNVGRSIGGLLSRAGHVVRFGSRKAGADAAAPDRALPIADAAAFGEVVLCAAPYGAWPELAAALAPHVGGKVVIDAANPYPERDGAFARDAIAAGGGAGAPVARLLPSARLVRAFSCVPWPAMVGQSNRPGERIGIPLAGDDAAAREVAGRLVTDAGFDPVDAGPLAAAKAFDPGAAAYNHPMTAADLRDLLASVTDGKSDRVVMDASGLMLAYIDAFKAGDMEALFSLFAPDAVVRFPYAPPGLPRVVDGAAAIRGYYGEAPKTFRFDRYEDVVIHRTTEPGVVIGRFRCEAVVLPTGRPYRQEYVTVLRERAGRIVDYTEFWDPLVVLEALGGTGAMAKAFGA